MRASGRKTPGLVTLRVSRVNAAKDGSQPGELGASWNWPQL